MIIKQHWSRHLRRYILSIVLIPMAGIGLYLLYRLIQAQKNAFYELTDTQIIDHSDILTRKIDLENIDLVELLDGEGSTMFGTGSILIKTPASELKLIAVSAPEEVKSKLHKAIDERMKALQPVKKKTQVQNDFDPGSLDRMDYLTGLWQQGLIDDDEYDKERKHFEN